MRSASATWLGKAANRSFPMPLNCEPCPGNTKIRVTRLPFREPPLELERDCVEHTLSSGVDEEMIAGKHLEPKAAGGFLAPSLDAVDTGNRVVRPGERDN